MDHFISSFKVFWRAERLIRQNELRLAIKKTMINAFAGLVGVFGLVMLSLSAFFALEAYMGKTLAALTVGGIDIIFAVALLAFSGSLKPSSEATMVTDMRDMAMGDMEIEVGKVESELKTLRKEVRRFVHNPIEALLPVTIAPLLTAISKGLRSSVKKQDKPADDTSL